LMLVLSVASVAVMLERAHLFRVVRADVPELMTALAHRMRAGDLRGARELLAASPSVEAAVAYAGLCELAAGPAAAREAMAGALLMQRARLERHLGFLGTLASNAPFIGLFGTVIGVIMAFEELGAAGHGQSVASAAVMVAIAEALAATAVGIAVAVPAVAAFNLFQNRVRVIADQATALGHVLLTHAGADRADDGANGHADAMLDRATSALAWQTTGEG